MPLLLLHNIHFNATFSAGVMMGSEDLIRQRRHINFYVFKQHRKHFAF